MKAVVRWEVKVTPEAERQLIKLLKDGVLTEDDQLAIVTWGKMVAEFGPEALRAEGAVWRDHELKAEWAGYRSSSFSLRGRLVYKIEDRIVRVLVVRITATHDYGKGKKK